MLFSQCLSTVHMFISYVCFKQFNLLSENLEVFKNESLLLELALSGNEIPDQCYIQIGNQKIRMKTDQNGQFSYLFETVPNDIVFSFLSAGYQSKSYTIITKVKPELISFDVQLKYPPHTHKKPSFFSNNGNNIFFYLLLIYISFIFFINKKESK